MVEIGVAHREPLALIHAAPELTLDFRRARQTGGRVHRHVALGAKQEDVEAAPLLGGLEERRDYFVGAGVEPVPDTPRRVLTRQKSDGNDGGVRISLECAAEGRPFRARRVSVDHD